MLFELASNSWGKEEIEAIQRVVDSGHFTMGYHIRLFEEDFGASSKSASAYH